MICSAQQLKQQLRSTLVAVQLRGDTAFNTSIVLAAVQGLIRLPGRCVRSSLHSFAAFPPVHVPNKPHHFCGCKTKCLLTYLHPVNQCGFIKARGGGGGGGEGERTKM